MRAISTVVAHFLHTEGVTGSNPVSPIEKALIDCKLWDLSVQTIARTMMVSVNQGIRNHLSNRGLIPSNCVIKAEQPSTDEVVLSTVLNWQSETVKT